MPVGWAVREDSPPLFINLTIFPNVKITTFLTYYFDNLIIILIFAAPNFFDPKHIPINVPTT